MSSVLDPEELEALMAQEQGGAVEGKYNLARQDYAVQRLIPTLSLIQSQFAAAACRRMGEFISGIQSIETDRITVMKFDELQGALPAPCSISLVSGMPLGGRLIIAFESELVFHLVDRYFGGYGSAAADAAREQFSASEYSFMEILAAALLPDLGEAWKVVMAGTPTIESQCSDPRLLEGFSDADSLVATRFSVDIGDFTGGLWSVVPWSAIDAVRDSLAESGGANKKPASEEWRSRMATRLDETCVELVAKLPGTRISLQRVASLTVGEVIELPSAEEVLLMAGEQALLRASLGSHQGQIAVKVLGPAGRRRPDSDV